MRIETSIDGKTGEHIIKLKEVFSGLELESEYGERLTVCMRDTGFMVGIITGKVERKKEGK